jgi:hypothetical protein
MTDPVSLLWTILTIIGSTIVSVAGAAWWLKGQITGGEMAGLRESAKAHETWRAYAEARLAETKEQLTAALATNEKLQAQIASGEPKEILAASASAASSAVSAAIASNDAIIDPRIPGTNFMDPIRLRRMLNAYEAAVIKAQHKLFESPSRPGSPN